MPSLRRVWILRDLLKFPCEPKKKNFLLSIESWYPKNNGFTVIPTYRGTDSSLLNSKHPGFFSLLRCPNCGPHPARFGGLDHDDFLSWRLKSSKMWESYTPHKLIWLAGSFSSGNFEKGCFLFYWIRFWGKGWWWTSILSNYTLED